jgi:hypothetical protein
VTYPAQLHDPGGFIASLPRLCRQAVLIADSWCAFDRQNKPYVMWSLRPLKFKVNFWVCEL